MGQLLQLDLFRVTVAAVTAALLLISLRTLLRAFLLLRQRGRAASAP